MIIASTAASLPSAEQQRGAFRRGELRDCAGIAVGVATGALVWLVFLSLAHGRL
jgi:hypothetical protein